ELVKKQEYKQLALDGLETATDTMMNLCDVCLDISPMALQVYKVGLRSAQGDTAVAISTLLSAASSGLYTSLINIKLAKGAAWTIAKRSDLEKYFGRLHEYQYIHSGRLATMYNNI
ncbi:MAG: cyclodeaminase/cyclohydrolase family protein, partial [Chitinophagaceae bacterium]|nr:cyclodeaminase/cyclohydrolase family protein [Chitinophagaceae bacterium]